ncbi:MAG TPA: cytochrome c, partial [Terriglobia bacterium]|nr:cytochrome c [Terriglobia bacterium]
MKTSWFAVALVLVASVCRGEVSRASRQGDGSSSASQVFAIFEKRCASCHGDTGSARTYMLLERAAMVRTGKVVPGRAEDSLLFQRVTGAVGPIMPAGGVKLGDDDIAIIRRWIDEGAPEWTVAVPQARRFISNDNVISAIEQDLISIERDDSRRFVRYFILTNLHNAGDTKLTTYRAGLFKLLNSLSWDR